MSVTTLVLLLAAVVAVALGAAALHTARALRRQLAELHTELSAARQDAVASTAAVHPAAAAIPAARATPAAETPLADIRAAVADALAEERERELAEARAFWAAQEARDAADAPSLLGGLAGLGDELLDGRTDQRELPERQDTDRFDTQPFLPARRTWPDWSRCWARTPWRRWTRWSPWTPWTRRSWSPSRRPSPPSWPPRAGATPRTPTSRRPR